MYVGGTFQELTYIFQFEMQKPTISMSAVNLFVQHVFQAGLQLNNSAAPQAEVGLHAKQGYPLVYI